MAEETLTGANVVISSPAQQFTRTDIFQSLFYGKIYIGKIDKDPTDEENQISVFIEQEDNSLLEVPQPLRTNAAGFPVYNGKIVKFVTTQGHSMALYDANDVLMAYYDNVLKYDPDQFSGVVGNPDGLKVIGRAESVAQLRQIVGVPDQWINVASYVKGTHVGGGFFYWKDDISTTDDGGTFFRVNASGGWVRDMPNIDHLNIYHFGAPDDGVTDTMPAIQRMHAWSVNYISALSLAVYYAPGVQLPPGKFVISSMDLGTTEFNAFKMYGPPCRYGAIPRVTLAPINKTTTTPAFAYTARRMEVSNVHWDGKGSVQPFMVNRVTRGSYARVSCFVATDCGGRVFQVKDTIDTKFDQIYSYRCSKAFLWVTWSNENPGGWDHPTAIELSNCNFSSHTGEYAFSAIRSTQCEMNNVWFDHCEYPFDISQGGWILKNVTQENAANPAAIKYLKKVVIQCRFTQGAGLDENASGYDPSMDTSGTPPDWVTNAYEQGSLEMTHKGFRSKGGMSYGYEASAYKLQNLSASANWFEVGTIGFTSAIAKSCIIEVNGTAQFDSASDTNPRPATTGYGGGKAVIMVQQKDSTSKMPLSWYGEESSPISEVRVIFESSRRPRIFVKLRPYVGGCSFVFKTNDVSEFEGGIHFFLDPVFAAIDIGTVPNAVVAPARWSVNNGSYGFGMDFIKGSVSIDGITTSSHGIDFLPVQMNGTPRYIPLQQYNGSVRMPRYTLAELQATGTSDEDGGLVICTNSGPASSVDSTSAQLCYHLNGVWYRVMDNKRVGT